MTKLERTLRRRAHRRLGTVVTQFEEAKTLEDAILASKTWMQLFKEELMRRNK